MYNNSHSNQNIASGKLEKAILIHQPRDSSKDIEFMFNPNELVFQQSIQLNESHGARTQTGMPKVSFAYPQPCVLTISDILFDTYEQGTSVLEYINKLIKAVNFAESGPAANKRPPTYIFTWGQHQYLRCFVEQVIYKLNLFLSDGTPVQARVDLTLKEADEVSGGGTTSTQPNRQGDNRSSRTIFGR